MEALMNGIELTGTLYTSAQGDAKDKLAYAELIWDNDLLKYLSDINLELSGITNTLQESIDTKANIEDLSNVLAEKVVDSPNIDNLDVITREELKKDLFIDIWNKSWDSRFGKYDPDNAPDADHPFYGNEIWMTYDEALAVILVSNLQSVSTDNSSFRYMKTLDMPFVRTLLPLRVYNADIQWMFGGLSKLETIQITHYLNNNSTANVTNYSYCFAGCTSLKKVIGVLDLRAAPYNIFHSSNIPLEQFKVITNKSINFSIFPKINLKSLLYLVTNATNTSAITVTVHPDVYAKLTDTSNTEWYAVLTSAAAKNISFATT